MALDYSFRAMSSALSEIQLPVWRAFWFHRFSVCQFMMPNTVAADPPISMPVIRPFINPPFMRSLLPRCFREIDYDLAVVRIHGVARDALPPVGQILPEAGGELQGADGEDAEYRAYLTRENGQWKIKALSSAK